MKDLRQRAKEGGNILWSVEGFSAAMWLVFGFSLFVNVLVLALPIYTLQLFDRVLGSQNVDTLLLLTVAVLIAFVVQVVIDAVRSRILSRVSVRTELFLSPTVMEASLLASARQGRATAQPMRDLVDVKSAIASPGALALFDAPWAPVFLFVTFVLHPWIGYLTLVGLVLLLSAAVLHAWYISRASERLNTSAISAFEDVQDYADNADALVSMGMRDAVTAAWSRMSIGLASSYTAMTETSASVQSTVKFIRLVLQAGVMGLGCYLVLQRELTPGAMIAASIIMARALAPAEHAISSWRAVSSGRQALRRLTELLAEDAPPRPQIKAENVVPNLRLDRVGYLSPDSGQPIIHPLSLSVKPGTILGLVGPTGSGKSTLARMIVGVLAPSAGRVLLDGIDVTRRAVHDLGGTIGYLPQDSKLFHGSVVENIARLGEAAPEGVREAAEKAGVATLINHLPDGYDTKIGRGGVRLSGGQQQRIGLARALFGNPRLIVLDEPDASLDPEGLECLVDALKAERDCGATIVMVSHRPELLQIADRLILIQDGRIKADNTPQLLLPAYLQHQISGPSEVAPQLQSPKQDETAGTQDTASSARPAEKVVFLRQRLGETPEYQEENTSAGAALQPDGPVPVAQWPDHIKERWRESVIEERLPADAAVRRNMAASLGWWLWLTNSVGLSPEADINKPAAVQILSVFDTQVRDLAPEATRETLIETLSAIGFASSALSLSKVHNEEPPPRRMEHE